ncbi:MAG: PaaI family thioesterase [candidate division NC10 bacterium]|nr:PaaI family thioesterase [candidate division NC10 bacterium]
MQNLWWREDPQNRAYRECGSEASSGACRVVIVGGTEMGQGKVTKEVLEQLAKEHCPFLADFGIHCEELGSGYAVVRMKYDERYLRPGKYITGGMLMTLADIAIYYAILSVVGLKPMTVTNDFKMNFLRPAVGGDVLARAEVLKTGRRIVYGEIRLFMAHEPEKLIGHATSSYVLPDE